MYIQNIQKCTNIKKKVKKIKKSWLLPLDKIFRVYI